MNVEIINIGDELLIGQVVNTNAAWMAQQLNFAGFSVVQTTVIHDDREQILSTLREAEEKASVILISGGIGPTNDDITKTTLCEYFRTQLVFSPSAYHDIEDLFRRRGYPVTELNRCQAELPEGCTEIPNKLGTARGMWFEKKGPDESLKVFVSMPGVPFEMKSMMTGSIIPELRKRFSTPFIYHRTVMTQGVGESFLAAALEDWERSLPAEIKLAWLPQPGIVRLRLSGTGADPGQVIRLVDDEVAKLYDRIPQHIFGLDEETLEEVTGRILKERGKSISAAESCTGGYIAHLITSVPGSSGYFKGGIVAYANETKYHFLKVPEETIACHGAVSEEVVTLMASNCRKMFGTDYSVASSGIAGPDGGTAEKPVGTTWIAIATPDGVWSKQYLFGDNRERNIRRTALEALMRLYKELTK